MTKLVPGRSMLAIQAKDVAGQELPIASDEDTASIRPMYLCTISASHASDAASQLGHVLVFDHDGAAGSRGLLRDANGVGCEVGVGVGVGVGRAVLQALAAREEPVGCGRLSIGADG